MIVDLKRCRSVGDDSNRHAQVPYKKDSNTNALRRRKVYRMNKETGLKKRVFGYAVALVLFLLFASQATASVSWPHENSDLEADPNVVWGKLENGFRYVLMKNKEPKDRVSMHLNVQAGSLNEREDERGVAHFLEHMLFQGSENFEPGELVKYFQSIGMQFGPDANAHTGLDETVYDIILPNGDKKSIEDGLLVLRDYARGALLLEEQIDSERKIVLAEKRNRDSASYRTFEATFDFEFPESIISKRLPIGKEEVVANADRELLKGFYDAWYRPEKMMIVMVGNFDPAVAEGLISEKFGEVAARASVRQEPDLGKVRHYGIKPFHHFEEDLGDASVAVEVLEMTEEQPDSATLKEFLLKKDIADAIVQNRLDSMLRKPDVPFTSASIGSGLMFNKIFTAEISAKSSEENWEKSLAAIEQELRRAIQYGFSASELERVRKEFLNDLKTAVEKESTRNSRNLAGQIVRTVNSDRVFMSPRQELELYVPMIESFTPENIHEAFKDTWNKRHRLVLVTGNAPAKEGEKDPAAYVLSRFNASREIAVAAPEDEAAVEFPYLPPPEKKGAVAKRNELPDLGIVQVDYENGLRLNYKKTDFKAKEILVELSFGAGESGEPADKPGLSMLSKSVVNESGVGPLNAEDLNRALAGKNTVVKFDIEEDKFVFRADTVPGEIDLTMQLLYARLTDPAFREEACRLAMQRYRLAYLESSRSVDGAIQLHADRFLAGGDSRFGLPDYETFKRLGLDDVRSWIETAFRQNSPELSVVGDFDPEPLEKSVSKHLGGFAFGKGAQESSNKMESPAFPAGDSLNLPVETEIPKAIVVLAYPTDDFWEIGQTRRLSILADIVSERLRVTVREKLGASYSQYAYNYSSRAYPGYGVLRQVVFAEPGEVRNLVDVMKRISEELVVKGIEQDELRRSLEPTLTSIREMRRKNRYWLGSVLSGSKRHPEQLEWARTIIDDYGSITAQDIAEVAKTFLENGKAADVVIVPAREKQG